MDNRMEDRGLIVFFFKEKHFLILQTGWYDLHKDDVLWTDRSNIILDKLFLNQ